MRIVRWLLIGLVTLITAEVALALALVANLPRMSAGEMVEVRGEQLRVINEGEGPAVILLHAATAHATDMEVSIAGTLRAQGYRVISVDRPGQGWSSLNDPALIHLDAQGDLLAELMTVLGLPTATVVGHSLGGSVALASAGETAKLLVSNSCTSSTKAPYRMRRRTVSPKLQATALASTASASQRAAGT